jgi:hypothetical protein
VEGSQDSFCEWGLALCILQNGECAEYLDADFSVIACLKTSVQAKVHQ